MWDTVRCPPRTANSSGTGQFKLPGDTVAGWQEGWIREGNTNPDFARGGDRLYDDKSETDYTVGALMNMIAVEAPLWQGSGRAQQAMFIYYITVQVTDGLDVNGDPVLGTGNEDGDGLGITEPDWDEGTVLAEKRLMVLLNTGLPATDPDRMTVFNWAIRGRSPER